MSWQSKLQEQTTPYVVYFTIRPAGAEGQYFFFQPHTTKRKLFVEYLNRKVDKPLNLSDYGTIIATGKGNATKAIKAEMAEKFDIIYIEQE